MRGAFSFHWAKVIFGSHNFPPLLHHTVLDLFDGSNGTQERKPANANLNASPYSIAITIIQ